MAWRTNFTKIFTFRGEGGRLSTSLMSIQYGPYWLKILNRYTKIKFLKEDCGSFPRMTPVETG